MNDGPVPHPWEALSRFVRHRGRLVQKPPAAWTAAAEPALSGLCINGLSVPGFDPRIRFYDLGTVLSDRESLVISASVAGPSPDGALPSIHICEALLYTEEQDQPPPLTHVHDQQSAVTDQATVPFHASHLYFYPVQVKSPDGLHSRTYTIRIRRIPRGGCRAVFILPGTLDSELATVSGRPVWPRLVFSRQAALRLACLPDGRPARTAVAVDPALYRAGYGIRDKYGPLVRHLRKKLPDSHDVIYLPYDWRLDIRASARKLQIHIALGDYDSVFLIGYSMGGLVASSYLAQQPEAGRVEHLAAIASPFLGLPKAAFLLMSGKAMNLPYLRFSPSVVRYRQLGRDMLSGSQLLPNDAYFRWHAHYISFAPDPATHPPHARSTRRRRLDARNWDLSSHDRTVQDLTSCTASWQFLCARFGMPERAEFCRAFHESFYLDGRHIVNQLADAPGRITLMVGTDRPTLVRVHVIEQGKHLRVQPVWAPDGDGTVPALSASFGESVPHATFRFAGFSHLDLITRKRCLRFLTDRILGHPVQEEADLPQPRVPGTEPVL